MIRGSYVLIQTRAQFFDATFVASDSLLYLRLARSILAGQGLSIDGAPTAFVGPGYPLFIAPLLALGADPSAIGIVQAVIGAVSVGAGALTAWLLARQMWPSRARDIALVTGGVSAIYPHLVFWTGYILTETLFVSLLAVGLALMIFAWQERHVPAAALGGLMFGLAAITRPPALAMAIGLLAWWFLSAVRTRSSLVPAFAFALCVALPVGAWASRNVLVLGAPVVTSTEAGYVFYQGNSLSSTGGSRGYVDSLDFTPLTLPAGLSEVERDRIYLDRAIADMREDPARVITRWPSKLGNMWRITYDNASARNVAVTAVTYLPVLVAGIGGAMVLARSGPFGAAVVPALFLLGWMLLHVLVTGMIRFRLPAEHVLVITTPFALFWAWDRLRGRPTA